MNQDVMLQGGDVLVVDDDPMILELVTELLADEGYSVRRAPNGMEAWLAIQTAQPALVVTDIRMPVMDGSELVTRLRARGYEIPILIIAASPALAEPLLQLPSTAFIAKPFDLDELLDGIRQYAAPAVVAVV